MSYYKEHRSPRPTSPQNQKEREKRADAFELLLLLRSVNHHPVSDEDVYIILTEHPVSTLISARNAWRPLESLDKVVNDDSTGLPEIFANLIPSPQPTTEEIAISNLSYQELQELIDRAQLTSKQLTALHLRIVEELDLEQIKKIMRVKSHQYPQQLTVAALGKIRKQIESEKMLPETLLD